MGRKSAPKQRISKPDKQLKWLEQIAVIYRKHGMRKHSMDELAAELGVSKATLYKYFPNREEIVAQVLQLILKRIRHFRRYLFDEDIPYIDRYFVALEFTANELTDVSNDFLLDLNTLYPNLWKIVTEFIKDALRLLRDFYAIGVKEGLFQPIDPAVMALTDQTYFTALANAELLQEHGLKLETALRDYFRMKFTGVFKPEFHHAALKSNLITKEL